MGNKKLHRIDAIEVAIVDLADGACLDMRFQAGQTLNGVERGTDKVERIDAARLELGLNLRSKPAVDDGVEHKRLDVGVGAMLVEVRTNLLHFRHLGKALDVNAPNTELGRRGEGDFCRRLTKRVRDDVNGGDQGPRLSRQGLLRGADAIAKLVHSCASLYRKAAAAALWRMHTSRCASPTCLAAAARVWCLSGRAGVMPSSPSCRSRRRRGRHRRSG